MASEIFVNKITGTSGTSGGAPITLSGDTATLGSSVSGLPGFREYDMWALNNHITPSSGTTTITDWTRFPSPFEKLGTGMSHSSGTFTFPSTGYWTVTFAVSILIDGGDGSYFFGDIFRLVDSTETRVIKTMTYAKDNSYSRTGATSSCTYLFKVTTAGTGSGRIAAKFKYTTDGASTLYGFTSSTEVNTHLIFTKVSEI